MNKDSEDEYWESRANCGGAAYELFEYQDLDSPMTTGMDYRQRIAFNSMNFDRAIELCVECPVMLICGEKATDEEKYWTVRGGELPGRFHKEADKIGKLGRPKGGGGGPRICKRGHVAVGQCVECKKILNANRKRRSRAESAAGRARDAV